VIIVETCLNSLHKCLYMIVCWWGLNWRGCLRSLSEIWKIVGFGEKWARWWFWCESRLWFHDFEVKGLIESINNSPETASNKELLRCSGLVPCWIPSHGTSRRKERLPLIPTNKISFDKRSYAKASPWEPSHIILVYDETLTSCLCTMNKSNNFKWD